MVLSAGAAVRAMETATDDDDKGGSSSGGFSFSPPKPPSAGGDGGDKKHKKDKKKKHKKEKGGGDADARKGPMVDAFMKAIEAQRAGRQRFQRPDRVVEPAGPPLQPREFESGRRKVGGRPAGVPQKAFRLLRPALFGAQRAEQEQRVHLVRHDIENGLQLALGEIVAARFQPTPGREDGLAQIRLAGPGRRRAHGAAPAAPDRAAWPARQTKSAIRLMARPSLAAGQSVESL